MSQVTSYTAVGTTDTEYRSFVAAVRGAIESLAADEPLFTTDAENLFDVYLSAFPAEEQQHYRCNCCRQFINRFGGLVTIDGNGATRPVFWELAMDQRFGAVAHKLWAAVANAKVTGVFLHTEGVLGTPITGAWEHVHATLPLARRYPKQRVALDAYQAGAAKVEDHKNVTRALGEFPAALLEKVVSHLQIGTLTRSEKFVAPAAWLFGLSTRWNAANRRFKENIVWRAVATAPSGFCHVRSSVIGSLLDDLASGSSFEAASQRFTAKLSPTQYQRPQVAPSAGTIAQAEKLFETLGLAPSLGRRFARIEEIPSPIWRVGPPKEQKAASGVFGHLLPQAPETSPAVSHKFESITFARFARSVLPNAVKLEVLVPQDGAFTAVLTASDLNAPPILRWDRPEARNPFSWYLYTSGSGRTPYHWNLRGGVYVEVTAVTESPAHWAGQCPGEKDMKLLVLKGARDLHANHLCLFPEILRSDLHGVRSVIEKHSASRKPDGGEEASVCGLLLSDGNKIQVRATLQSAVAHYTLDRLD